MSGTFTDLFCGAGGSSLGLAAAGFELRLAANHWDRAVATHSENFPGAEHLCADVSGYDMRRLPRTDVLWASPECTWHSPAGGRRRLRAQLDLLADYVPTEAGVRSRATAFDVVRAAEAHRYPAVVVENVVEFAGWALFGEWLAMMAKLGYRHQLVCVDSAHVGGPANPRAPQWRGRVYVVFTLGAVPAPGLDLRPPAWCGSCAAEVAAVQAWKNPRRPRVGKYRAQYVYRCPNAACRHAVVEPYVRPAAAAIDWSDLGQRIGDRARPLAPATLRRIHAGLRMFAAQALLVDRRYSAGPDGPRVRTVAEPVGTVTAGGHSCRVLVLPPTLVPAGGTWDDAAAAVGDPMRTRTTSQTDALVVPPVVVNVNHQGDLGRPYPAGAAPLATRTTRIGDGVAVPPGAFYAKSFGGSAWQQDTARGVSQPLGAVTPEDHHALVVPYRRACRPRTTGGPPHTLHTGGSAALAQAAAGVADCRFRMLTPREHLRAQRFPDGYVVLGNKGEQTMQAGNAVSVNVAQWIGERVAAALDGRPGGEAE